MLEITFQQRLSIMMWSKSSQVAPYKAVWGNSKSHNKKKEGNSEKSKTILICYYIKKKTVNVKKTLLRVDVPKLLTRRLQNDWLLC